MDSRTFCEVRLWDVVRMSFVVLCASGTTDDGPDRPRRRQVVLSGVPAGRQPKVYARDLADRFSAGHRQESVSVS